MERKPTLAPLKQGLETIQKASEKYAKWTSVVNEMVDTNMGIPNFDLGLIDTIIGILEEMYNDTTGLISWWVWENNFGKDLQEKDGMWDADGNPIPLRSIEELYNELMKSYDND